MKKTSLASWITLAVVILCIITTPAISFKKTFAETFEIPQYEVKNGEDIFTISEKSCIPIQLWMFFNPKLMLFGVRAGEKVNIPGVYCSIKDIEQENDAEDDFSWLDEEIKELYCLYPNMRFGMAIYSLKENKYVYKQNERKEISTACTVKAAYANYVLEKCEEEEINIFQKKLEYKESMRNGGSGDFKNIESGGYYSISYLLYQLLVVSDNTTYNILLGTFNLDGFQQYLNEFGGQQLKDCRFGAATVENRINEWINIYNYINSERQYSEVLKEYLQSAKFCYLAQGFEDEHEYLHKSGWSDGASYNSCSDVILTEGYIVAVISDDYVENVAHTDVIRKIGKICDENLF